MRKSPLVPPSGNASKPLIAFVGEAPGEEEVRKQQTFIGRSGRLLRQTLSELGYDLESVYYTNTCLCRPEKNRDPSKAEVACCVNRLLTELRAVSPMVIVPLGNVPLAALSPYIIGSSPAKGKITKRRGIYKPILFGGKTYGMIPSLHPAGILRFADGYPDFVSDLEFAKSVIDGEPPTIEPNYGGYEYVDTQERFESVLADVLKAGWCAVDIETTGLDFQDDEIRLIGISIEPGTASSIDYRKLIDGNDINRKKLSKVLSTVKVSCHNGQFDVLVLETNHIPVNYAFDTMLAHYELDERKGTHGLKRLAIQRYRAPEYDIEIAEPGKVKAKKTRTTRRKSDSDDSTKTELKSDDQKLLAWSDEAVWNHPKQVARVVKYNGADADYTARLTIDLAKELREQEDLLGLHHNLIIPAARHFMELEREGMLVDVEYLHKLGKGWIEERSDLERQMKSFKGAADLNLNSPKQISEYLYKTLGLKQMGGGKLPTISQDILLEEIRAVEDPDAQEYWRSSGSRASKEIKADTTSLYMLWWLAQQHDFPRILVKHRLLDKKIGTYYVGILDKLWPDERVRPQSRIHGTKTGRISSTDPNIHGTPKIAAIKRMYIADPGCIILYADYSQAEVRMMAHFADDLRLIKALHEGDIHHAIMKDLFRISDEQYKAMTKDQQEARRRGAKYVTFGVIYERSARGLAPQLGVPVREAQAYIDSLFTIMPGVARWIAQQHQLVVKQQYVTSLYGRRRRFDLIMKSNINEIRRQAVNFPIQSSVSDMTLLAHMRIVRRLREEDVPVKVWPHIHDALMVMVPERYEKVGIRIIREEMSNPGFDTAVPFICDIATGRSWGDLKPVVA